MNDRRATDPILKNINEKVDRIDNTIHGNGKMGLKTRVHLVWYAMWGLFIAFGILAGCYFK
jgi:hypothetical protein